MQVDVTNRPQRRQIFGKLTSSDTPKANFVINTDIGRVLRTGPNTEPAFTVPAPRGCDRFRSLCYRRCCRHEPLLCH